MIHLRRFATGLVLLLAWGLAQAAPAIHGRMETLGDPPNSITVLYLWGTPYERGLAHGQLCATQVKQLIERLALGACLALHCTPEKLDEAWQQMAPFVPRRYQDEMRGLADGAGVSLRYVRWAHAIPDLSEFHCTFFAAWGKATHDGHLQQIRALDYATEAGLQQFPALIVERTDSGQVFVNIGWLGFLGCVSGMNASHIAVSEIGENFGADHETLAGEPMPFVLRDVLENARTLDEGVRIIRRAHRTSSYLYCVGDGKIPSARALRTARDFCEVYSPADYPGERLDEVVYWSMGWERNGKWNRRVHDALQGQWGQMDHRTGTRDIMRELGTGNLHAIAYDVTALKLWVANASPGPQIVPAYDRRFVPFDLRRAAAQLP
ncbi:C45 family autoproteolytic acyltransferase/hydrolase [bacterium]|nr:C45 family autoproteolytic acyltransferase/hydrolase [bacterium]